MSTEKDPEAQKQGETSGKLRPGESGYAQRIAELEAEQGDLMRIASDNHAMAMEFKAERDQLKEQRDKTGLMLTKAGKSIDGLTAQLEQARASLQFVVDEISVDAPCNRYLREQTKRNLAQLAPNPELPAQISWLQELRGSSPQLAPKPGGEK